MPPSRTHSNPPLAETERLYVDSRELGQHLREQLLARPGHRANNFEGRAAGRERNHLEVSAALSFGMKWMNECTIKINTPAEQLGSFNQTGSSLVA